MMIVFDEMKEMIVPNLNGGMGSVAAKLFLDERGKIMMSRIPQGASIGMHTHEHSSEINYVVSGQGIAVCRGEEEALRAGVCHYCPQGDSHSIRNTAKEDLVLFTVVTEG